MQPDGSNHFMGVNDVPEWTLGDRLRRSLRHADISVADMATDLDVSLATMSRWLNDHGPVKRSILRLWAMTTGVSLEWLETGKVAPDTRRYLRVVNSVLTTNRCVIPASCDMPAAS